TLFYNISSLCYIYSLSLHDALPIFRRIRRHYRSDPAARVSVGWRRPRDLNFEQPQTDQFPAAALDRPHKLGLCRYSDRRVRERRSEEHTSELQSPDHLVCRLLLEKK